MHTLHTCMHAHTTHTCTYAHTCTHARTHTQHTHLLCSLLRSKKVDITPSDTRINTITIATAAPALLALDFLSSLLPPLLPPALPALVVLAAVVVTTDGGASVS